MYTSSGSSALGPAIRIGSGAATGAGLAFTGFPVLGFAILGLVLLVTGLVLTRMAVVRRHAEPLPVGGEAPAGRPGA